MSDRKWIPVILKNSSGERKTSTVFAVDNEQAKRLAQATALGSFKVIGIKE